MESCLMCLGQYVFAISTTAYEKLQRKIGWHHPSTTRIGRRAAHQYLGKDEETITLSGRIFPELATNGIASLDELEAMGNSGKSFLLIAGDNTILGDFIIESLETTSSEHLFDGTPQKIEFTLNLKRVDDEMDPTDNG